MTGLIFYLVMISILLLMLVFSLKMFIITSRAKKIGKQTKQKRINELNSLYEVNFFHEIGLTLPERTHCQLYLCDDRIVIEGNGITFNLANSKIIDISLKTDREIEKAYVSSSGGAVGGALLFGPVGALIGGRVKEKKNTKIITYLIITYEKDDSPDYIAFDVGINSMRAIKFIDCFKKNNPVKQAEVNL